MEVKGFVKLVGASITVSPTYEKRELIVTTDEQYPQTIMIEFPQGKCNAQLDQLTPGERVTIGINLGGREWVNPNGETKYFNSIKGWSVRTDTTPQNATPAPATPAAAPAQNNAPAMDFKEEEHDDLPF